MPDEQPLSLPERLALVYERLDQLPPARTASEAFTQLATTLDEVEEQYSGVPRDPNPGLKFDGRMYPPREDFTERTADGGLRATTRGNQIDISPDGTTSILSRKTGDEVYRRPGAGPEQTLDPELRKLQSLAATNYPAGLRSPTAIPASTQPAATHHKPERDDRTHGR
ncbi:hypothetical protein [Streptomyces sp. SID13031]|uniref:hypothetical protein n=1 Tax=Streptomyces sp. SID13031 TaxID=2706046 RepID=UPI0013C61627|nr:hypothetical protein [Streptomyces sp. SID13031]NEA30600.1 hypothetical protein [Streptomyces sp. SID13031]